MIKIITFNIFSHKKIQKESSWRKFENIINQYNPDVILLQEDIYNAKYPGGYSKINQYRTNEGIMNTILVNNDVYEWANPNDSHRLPTNFYVNTQRGAVSIFLNGISICNVHLSGGRWDDTLFDKIVDLRDYQVATLLNYDIVAGDFNSNPNDAKFPYDHHVYLTADSEMKELFKKYFKSGHQPLLNGGMVPILIDKPTDEFGGNPDHIYYNPNKLIPKRVEVIDMINIDLSDHNAIYAEFLLKTLIT